MLVCNSFFNLPHLKKKIAQRTPRSSFVVNTNTNNSFSSHILVLSFLNIPVIAFSSFDLTDFLAVFLFLLYLKNKALLVLFMYLASCFSKHFLVCLFITLYLTCQNLYDFLLLLIFILFSFF